MKNRGSIDIVLFSSYQKEYVRIIADACNIKYDEIVTADDKTRAILMIAKNYNRDIKDTVVISSYSSDLEAAKQVGVLGLFYGYDYRFSSFWPCDAFLRYIGFSKLK